MFFSSIHSLCAILMLLHLRFVSHWRKNTALTPVRNDINKFIKADCKIREYNEHILCFAVVVICGVVVVRDFVIIIVNVSLSQIHCFS